MRYIVGEDLIESEDGESASINEYDEVCFDWITRIWRQNIDGDYKLVWEKPLENGENIELYKQQKSITNDITVEYEPSGEYTYSFDNENNNSEVAL